MRDTLIFGSLVMAAALGLAACSDDGGGTSNGGTGGTGTGGTETGGDGGAGAGSTESTGGSGGASTGGSGGTGTGGNGTGGTATGGTGTGGMGGDALAALSDEFEDANSLSDWTLLHQVLGLAAPHELLDIDTSAAGKLAIVPLVSAWYQDQMASFAYKEVSGDFRVEVDVAALKKAAPGGAPTNIFNSAGLLIRDPASVAGNQNWLMYNIGYQQNFIGVEGKATRSSQSQLILIPTNGVFAGRLRLCRIGNTVHMLRRLPGEAAWTETHTFPGSFDQTPAFTLPQTVQVGMIDNAYTVADVRAEFEYIRFAQVTGAADCNAD